MKIQIKKEQKHHAILAAAQEIFLSEGFVSTRMDRIAEVAGVTKQTVYRYFPSKADLFLETMRAMGSRAETSFLDHLDLEDPRTALLQFAKAFMVAHLTQSHLDTIRLLIAEGRDAPEILEAFFSVGPDEVDDKLNSFFRNRLGITAPDLVIRAFTGSLLAFRDEALMGGKRPSEAEIAAHADLSVDLLLGWSGITK